jgi:serpin B
MTRRDSLKLLGLLSLRAAIPSGRLFADRVRLPESKDPAMATATAAFGCDLFARLREKSGNLFFSPLSIETALAMTSGGARGDTLAEMNKVLHLPGAGAHEAAADLLRALREAAGGKFELSIANALWLQEGLAFKPEFLSATQTNYDAALRTVDFKQSEQARETINKWAEEQTKDKIKDLFARGTLSADNRLVLTNAIYFKGAWTTPFQKRLTKDEPFHVTDDKTVMAPLMRRGGQFWYFAGDGLQVVELPYRGDRTAMTVILPSAETGLAAVEAKLTADQLGRWVKAMAPKPGDVLLPRFETTTGFELKEPLQAMGMKLAFTPQADFGGMSAEPLMISKVVHKAFVDTNEEGTEAAAATGVGMKLAAMPVQQERFTFRADRPFMFVIRDTPTNTPLFVGRIANPTA